MTAQVEAELVQDTIPSLMDERLFCAYILSEALSKERSGDVVEFDEWAKQQ